MGLHKLTVILFLLVVSLPVIAQKQLLVLKKEKVLLRLYPGDEIVFKLKNSKTIRTTYVNNISDTALVTHRDTVPYHKIDRIYFKQHKFYNKLGSFFVIGGAGLFIVDQINVGIVQGNKPDLDASVTRVSVGALIVGLPMMLIHKKSQRIGYHSRVMMARPGSAFYKPNPKGYNSPFMDN